MKYFSTNKRSAHVSFREAVLRGQPDDKGLFFPERIPRFSFDELVERSNEQIAFEIIRPYVGIEISDESLFRICTETVNFDFPLVKISDTISTLELFHGPTMAFKDVGARFMSRCLQQFTKDSKTKTIVLVATSGDTGGAVASGFYGIDGVEVVILFPKGKVSRVQELQLTTLGKNITALEVAGTFDDCQNMAKTALADLELNEKIFLTSANSINIARWLPQQFYYFYALRQWFGTSEAEPVICVPSGNFGNICAGILAHVSGLPCRKFIAATNANDVIPNFLRNGEMLLKPPIATLSNAMDVANPSNFTRILEIFDRDVLTLKEILRSVSVSDVTTAETMRYVYEDYDYFLDPHGAVGYHALQAYVAEHPGLSGFFLETAHPVKFDSVEKIVGTPVEVPESVKRLLNKKGQKTEINAKYTELKEFLTGIN